MNSRVSTIVLALFALAGLARAADKRAPLPELNQKVLAFAREHKGKKVGDGVCISLAMKALAESGARSFPEPGDDDPADFVWGEPVEPLEKLLPGDILQFRDAVFEGRDLTKSWRHTMAHHTAIVASVSKTKAGLIVTILHQNTGRSTSKTAERQVVKETRLRFRELQPGGSVKGYRPRKA